MSFAGLVCGACCARYSRTPHASEISMPARSTINSRLGISISPCHTQPEDLRVLDRGPENEEIIVERIVKIQSCPAVQLQLGSAGKPANSGIVDEEEAVLQVEPPVETSATQSQSSFTEGTP